MSENRKRLSGLAVLAVLAVLILSSGCITREATQPQPDTTILPITHSSIPTPVPAPVITETPTSIPMYPKPDYTPGNREYTIMQRGDLIVALDPSSYVTPENVWVKWQASQLYINEDGQIKYKDTPVPYLVDQKGNVLLWTDDLFINEYSFDIYGSNLNRNNIPWLMPEYYITQNRTGVCSAWANTVSSLMLSGEMSVYQDGELKKQVIPAKTVVGYAGEQRDAWVEYKVYERVWRSSTGIIENPYGEVTSVTTFAELKTVSSRLKPVFEFDNKHFGEYMEWHLK